MAMRGVAKMAMDQILFPPVITAFTFFCLTIVEGVTLRDICIQKYVYIYTYACMYVYVYMSQFQISALNLKN